MQTPVIRHAPVILSGAKDPLPAGTNTSSARSFNYAVGAGTDHWPLTTDH
jgi:hypothetical protein